jgi:diacylglycerol kinase (ATP)
MAFLVADALPISSLLPAVVFVNPISGRGRARSYVPRIQKAFEAASAPVQFIWTKNVEDLETAAHVAIVKGKRLLLALGGDGTFQCLVNAAYLADVVVGILPTGGGNDFAAALNLPGDSLAAAQAILQGRPIAVDLARARTADGRERLYLGGGGLGLDAEAARHAGEGFNRLPGRSRYVASALRALFSYPPVSVRVEFPPRASCCR